MDALPADWSSYQVRIDGKDKLVGDLTTDELRRALCQSINALEDVSVAAITTTERIEAWRKDEAFWDAAADRVHQARLRSRLDRVSPTQ